MNISQTRMVERIARVLAAERLSANGRGRGESVGQEVDLAWIEHVNEAKAVLKALREPDEDMAAVGDTDTWTAMVLTALGEIVPTGERPRTFAPSAEGGPTYQKPLG